MSAKAEPIAGQSVLVTGAARGIGAETARQLARRGARVTLAGLEPELLEQVAAECGPEAQWVEVDITDREALDRAVAAAVERFGGLDMLVANAGVGAGGTVRTMPDEAWERVVEINLLGTYRTVRAALPHLIDRAGHLIVVASVSAIVPDSPAMSAYAASKAGVEAFARSLRLEVAHLGVTVGIAYLSWVDTDMVRGGEATRPAFKHVRAALKGPLAKTQPLSKAVAAIVEGAERRSRTIALPGWVTALSALRGVLGPAAAHENLKTAAQLVQATEAESAQLGDAAYRPGGAGGEAAVRRAREPASR